MITEDYVSFETAKLLKEKGFDESVRYYFIFDNEIAVIPTSRRFNSNSIYISAPTLQMAMKWLREVHKLHISVEMGFDVDYSQYFFYVPSVCRFSNKSGEYQTPFGEKEFDTYEEAAVAAIVSAITGFKKYWMFWAEMAMYLATYIILFIMV